MKKLIVLLAVFALLAIFMVFDLQRYFSFAELIEHKQQWQDYTQAHFILAASLYFVIYTVVFALALPIGAIMTLAGGAIFGLAWGVVLVSFASTLGSTLAFLLARFLLHDWVHKKMARRLAVIDRGVQQEGAFYLFALRVVPLFPPAIINLAMGLTSIKTWTFYWVSQVGMLAATVVYINAGTELAKIDQQQSFMTPELIFAFVLLGLFPFIAKWILGLITKRRLYSAYKKPSKFETNLVVIGAGSGGLVSAYIAAMLKAKVILIEKNKMGGDCLNTGCVPSKAFIRSAKIAHTVQHANAYGIGSPAPTVDFSAVMARVQQAIAKIEPHDSIERYTSLGVDCVQGEAKIISPYHVQVGSRCIATKNIIVATGGKPKMLEIEGLAKVPVYTSDSIWSLTKRPEKLLVIGAGPIGCELAQAFQRLGSSVGLITHGEQLLSKEDKDVSELVKEQFLQEGVQLFFKHKALRCVVVDNGFELRATFNGQQVAIPFTHILMAAGREANTKHIGLNDLNITCLENGEVKVDAYLRTQYPNIYAVGDAAGPYQFTHAASHQAWYAVVNALFGRFKKFKVDYSVIPRAIFIDPEVARVGLNEREALAGNIEYEVTRYSLDDLDRAIVDGETQGFIKVLTPKGRDKILGVTIVGSHAAELINEFIAVMKRGGGLSDIMNTIHIYPTFSEANKFVAGAWRQEHKPQRLLAWVERFHRWVRG